MARKPANTSTGPGAADTKATAPGPLRPADWRHVTRLQLAELIGVHPDTVTDYARSGMPVVTRGGAGREGVYDAVQCLAWWRSQQGTNTKEAAQARAYEANAALNELKLQVQQGKLIPFDEAMLAGQHYTKAWTAKVRALPRQMVQAGLVARELEAQANAFVRTLLEEIARWRTVGDTTRAAAAMPQKRRAAK